MHTQKSKVNKNTFILCSSGKSRFLLQHTHPHNNIDPRDVIWSIKPSCVSFGAEQQCVYFNIIISTFVYYINYIDVVDDEPFVVALFNDSTFFVQY